MSALEQQINQVYERLAAAKKKLREYQLIDTGYYNSLQTYWHHVHVQDTEAEIDQYELEIARIRLLIADRLADLNEERLALEAQK